MQSLTDHLKYLEISAIRYQLVKDVAHQKKRTRLASGGSFPFTLMELHQAVLVEAVILQFPLICSKLTS